MKTNTSGVVSILLFSFLLSAVLTVLCLLGFFFLDEKSKEGLPAINPSPSIVVLDAGHGGEDGGTSGFGLVEKNLNLEITLAIGDYLEKSGIPVVYTRTEDTLLYDKTKDCKGRKKAMDLTKRLDITRQTENPIFVSIHMNAYPSSSCRGLQVYYSKNHNGSELLSQIIQTSTQNLLQPYNHRKIKQATSSIFLLDRMTTPAILVECGFLSNKEDCLLLSSSQYRQKLALVIASGIVEYWKNT